MHVPTWLCFKVCHSHHGQAAGASHEVASADARSLLGADLCRAYSIDKQLLVEAQAAGFVIQEVPETRRDLGGSLEGVVYSLTFMESACS